MPKTILHTRVSDSFYFEESPEEIAHLMQTTQWHNLDVTVEENSDYFDFQITKLVGEHPEIIITGAIRRWQGTNTRCDFEGIVNVPSSNTKFQQSLVVLIVTVVSILFWRWVLIDLDGLFILYEIPFIMGLSILSTELLIAILVGGISYSLIVRDNSDGRRWDVQQEMGWIIESLHTLGTALEHD